MLHCIAATAAAAAAGAATAATAARAAAVPVDGPISMPAARIASIQRVAAVQFPAAGSSLRAQPGS